jgi:hypothetical protein
VPRLLELHRQAIAAELSDDSEAAEVEFVAMAERADRAGTDPAAMFFWLISKRKGAYITHAEEEAACKRLREHRDGRTQVQASPLPPDLTRDQRFMLNCKRIADAHGQDAQVLAKRAAGWPVARWQQVEAQYAACHNARHPALSGPLAQKDTHMVP